ALLCCCGACAVLRASGAARKSPLSARPSRPLRRARAPGPSLDLLTRAKVREFRQRKHEVRRRLRRLPRVARRKNSLRVERIAKMPSFADRAKVAGMPWVYSFGYRFDSNAAAHPTPLTIEQFLEERPD